MENEKDLPIDDKPAALHKPANPLVAPVGVPGFHHVIEEGDGRALAKMELDDDARDGRADTGTGDQPGNVKDRFATPADR